MLDLSRFRDDYGGRAVCVTGGAGFIGSHLSRALCEIGAEVRVIDDLSNGHRANLDGADVTFVEASILDADALRSVVADAAVVFHQAALGSVPASVEQPVAYNDVNASGTLSVLEAARAAGVGRVVYAASSSAYGDQPDLPKVESMLPDPPSPYASSKLAGEHLCRVYALCYGLSTVSLRYFNIFGPGQRPDSPYAAVIPVFASALLAGRAPSIYGTGEQTRDFTHVSNAVAANLLAGASAHPLAGEVVNVACGERYSLMQLLETIAAAIGVEARCSHEPARAGDVMHSEASIDRARELLGYDVVTPFAEGIADTIEAFRVLAGR